MATDDRFFPCNQREARILEELTGADLERYKMLRHAGATVSEARGETNDN